MWRGGCIIKSVFLGDITSAYQKTPALESLLFDDFFNKGTISPLQRNLFTFSNNRSINPQLSTKHNLAGAVSSPKLFYGVFLLLPSALLWRSSMDTGAQSFPRISSRLKYDRFFPSDVVILTRPVARLLRCPHLPCAPWERKREVQDRRGHP